MAREKARWVVAVEGYFLLEGDLYFLEGSYPSYYGRTPVDWYLVVRRNGMVEVYQEKEESFTFLGYALRVDRMEVVEINEKSLRTLLKVFSENKTPPYVRRKRKLREEVRNLPDEIAIAIIRALKSGKSLLSLYRELERKYGKLSFSLSKFYKIANEIKSSLP